MSERRARIVVSLVPEGLDALEEALHARAHRGADIVEVRLDRIADDAARQNARLARIFAAFERPVVVALHGNEGFGSFDGSPGMRQSILIAARAAGADFVDVDLSFAGALGDLGGARILSSHAVAPEAQALDARAREADGLKAHPGDLVKLVPAARDVGEGLAVLRWLEQRSGDTGHSAGLGATIAFASGEAASFTRLLAPCHGAPLVYAAPSLDSASLERIGLVPAAPGQLTVEHMRRVWPAEGVGRSTRLAAVCGRPIGHSASPVAHGAALRAAGLDAMLVPVAPGTLLEALDHAASDRRWQGFSVTAPFKGDTLALATPDPVVAALGAANTLVRSGQAWSASNTDAPAVAASFAERGVDLKGARAVVVGAGGAGRAAAHALAEAGARVTILARRPAAAREVAASLSEDGRTVASMDIASPEALALAPQVVVHATPAGTGGGGDAPVPDQWLGPGCAVLDAVYKPRRTGLLERAAAAGAQTIEGSSWFAHQAVLQHLSIFAELYGGPSKPLPEVRARAARAIDRAAMRWNRGVEPGAPRVLCLVGLRGSGKSSIGRALAELWGSRWVDLDGSIAESEGVADAAALIEARGMEAFRDAEELALERTLEEARAMGAEGGPLVVSAGGGIVERSENVEALGDGAFCVWLRAPLGLLRERVAADESSRRPALTGPGVDEFEAMDARRRARFDRVADAVLDVAGRSVDECARAVAELWATRV